MNYATQIDPNLRHPEEELYPEPFWLSAEQRYEAYRLFCREFDERIYRPKPVTADDVPF